MKAELELLRVLINDQKELFKEQKAEIKALQKEVNDLKESILEIQVGRKWLWALFTIAAAAGAFIDTVLRAFKVY